MSSSATGVGMPICFLWAILLILTQKSSQKFGDVLGIMIKDLCEPNNPELLITKHGEDIAEKMRTGEIKGTFYVNYPEERADASNLVTKKKCYSE